MCWHVQGERESIMKTRSQAIGIWCEAKLCGLEECKNPVLLESHSFLLWLCYIMAPRWKDRLTDWWKSNSYHPFTHVIFSCDLSLSLSFASIPDVIKSVIHVLFTFFHIKIDFDNNFRWKFDLIFFILKYKNKIN